MQFLFWAYIKLRERLEKHDQCQLMQYGHVLVTSKVPVPTQEYEKELAR